MRKLVFIFLLVSILCFIFGCQNKAEKAELENFRVQAKVEEQNKAIVMKVFDDLNKRNSAVYLELFAPEYFWYFPSGNLKGLSREQESEFIKSFWAGFPDIRWKIEEVIAHGDAVIARFVVKGTHTGAYQGLPPTGHTFESGAIWLGHIKDGKIIEAKEEADLLGMLQQLGLELRPKDVEK